mmetsp:Transcript_17892/g.44597  ORF Transcript_17892/g.44597 Transcript_17892/m.44597 type:complete len:496 (-) Transcript_17892:350-1837(-)
MSAWGKNGSARSCEVILRRVEENDPRLTELVILPLKKFGSKEVFRLAKCLESTGGTHLRSLQASGHAIDDPNALEALGRGLSRIENIAIGDSEMGDGGVRALCRGMESNLKSTDGRIALKSVDLSYKNIGEDGLNTILGFFANLPSLQYMDLSRNENIGPSFDFCEAKSSLSLSTPIFPTLEYLDLSSCGLNTKSCASLLKAMGANGDEQDSTEETVRNLVLKLNSNDLSDQNGATEMMQILARGNLVAELFVSRCQIGDDGLKQIVDKCCSNKPSGSRFLRRLDLSHNNLTSLSSLAEKLHPCSDDSSSNDSHYFSHLQTLDLTGNALGPNLLASIECNPEWILSLEELDLSHTSCEISGAVELIHRCNSPNSPLKKLNLFGNGLGSDGFLELSKVLEGGHLSLEYLDLGGNGAEQSAVVALVKALKSPIAGGNKLQVLVVGGNTGGAELEKAVKEVQKVHPNLDIARDKTKKKNGNMPSGNMFNSTPGTSWMS